MMYLMRQTILMIYHTFFFRKLGKMLQNLSSAAVMIDALRVSWMGPISDFLVIGYWKVFFIQIDVKHSVCKQ